MCVFTITYLIFFTTLYTIEGHHSEETNNWTDPQSRRDSMECHIQTVKQMDIWILTFLTVKNSIQASQSQTNFLVFASVF